MMRTLANSRLKKALPAPVRKMARWCVDAGNALITLSVRTHKSRWEKVAKDPMPHWDSRNVLISSLIPDGSSVLDLGSGAQTLRRHLKPGCKYQPCDVVKSSPDVILCDFNAGNYPQPGMEYDFVVCSGIFEYIRRPLEFLQRISTLGRTIIFSFNPWHPQTPKFSRLAVHWNNHLTRAETECLFQHSSLAWQVVNVKDDGEIVYSLHIDPCPRIGKVQIPATGGQPL